MVVEKVKKKRKRKGRKREKGIGDVIGRVACILLFIFFTTHIIKEIGMMKACEDRVEAHIIHIEKRKRSNSIKRYAIVKYEVEDRIYKRKVEIGFRHPCAEGDTIEIHYDPQEPEQCIFRKFLKNEILFSSFEWGVFLFFIIFAFSEEKNDRNKRKRQSICAHKEE